MDIAKLRSYEQRRPAMQGEIDFIARDNGKPVVLAEGKAGRSPARGAHSMSYFQLDASDCDAITRAMERHGAPAYILHAEIVGRYEGPTTGFHCRSLWWTDVYTLREHFAGFASRGGVERGKAARFSKQAFMPIRELPAHVIGNRLVGRYRRRKLPAIALHPKRNPRKRTPAKAKS